MTSFRPSNGTEGMIFEENWCFSCEHRAAGCEIQSATMVFDIDDPNYPKEWVYGSDGKPTCTAFLHVDKEKRKQRCPLTADLFEDQ